MATTLLKLKELSQQTIEAIVKSPDAWKKYLNAAPNIFRYSFEDQLLIYAQAPKATAVATYDVWNKIMHRAVKKGSCGIGLIHTKRRYEKIDYVFDVTQTAEKYDSRSLNIWKVTEKNETLVRTYLQNTIDIEEGMESIPELLHELTRESVDDVIDDLQDALKEDVEGTYLEDLEEAIRSTGLEVTQERVDKLLEECHRIFDDKSGRNEMLAQKASKLFEEE